MTSCTSSSMNSCFGSSILIFFFLGDFAAFRPLMSLRGERGCSKTEKNIFPVNTRSLTTKSTNYLHFPEPERVSSNGSINPPFVYTELRTGYKYAADRSDVQPCDSLGWSSSGIDDYKNHMDKAETSYIRPDRLVMAHLGLDRFGLYVQFDRLEFPPWNEKMEIFRKLFCCVAYDGCRLES